MKSDDLLSVWAIKYIKTEYIDIEKELNRDCDCKLSFLDSTTFEETDEGAAIFIKKDCQQIFLGAFDKNYVFLDIANFIIFFVNENIIENYLKLFTKMSLTLFDSDFASLKEKIKSLNFENYDLIKIKKV